MRGEGEVVSPLDVAVGLYDRYESIDEVKHYYGLLAIYGLARMADAADDDGLRARCEKILRRFPGEVEHPRYNFPSYEIGGIAQAYLLATGRMDDRADLVREYADEMLNAPRDPRGIVVMPRQPESNKIWIDAAMATTPYLLFAGLALDEKRYIDEAVHQTVSMYDEFLDTGNGLLHQCKNFVGPGRYSDDHWGRGNGWGYLALAELVAGVQPDSPHRTGVVARFQALSGALLPHQSERGLWRQEIPDDHSYEEASGTGLILYGFGLGMRHGVLDPAIYEEPFRRGVAGLAGICINPDFSTEFSCPGCLAPGEGENKGTVKAYMTLRLPYRDERHSFGPLMLALTEAHRRGITAVPLRNGPLAPPTGPSK
jgi:unsaturated rhamnogalacturonyl hydrolase